MQRLGELLSAGRIIPFNVTQIQLGWDRNMLHYAIVFLIVALIAAVFGFGGIAAGAAGIAKILFVIFLIGAVVSFIMHSGRRI
jgi:uncharacterized membrane protein YtjA (UPF0391 family)